jgi:hypothetical protein
LQGSPCHWPLFIAPGIFIGCFSLQASTFHSLLFIAGQHFSLATFHCSGIFIGCFSLQASTFHWPPFIAAGIFIGCFSLQASAFH